MLLSKCPSLAARGRCHSVAVHARFGRDSGLILGPNGPNNNGNNNQRGNDSRLILPGQQRPTPGGRPQRVLTPEKQQGGRPGGEGSFLPDDSTLGLVSDTTLLGGPPTLNKYRPPAGFMNETLPDDGTANRDPQEMLSKLSSGAGHWHELAKFIPALNSKGYNSAVIEEMTGITPAEQNKWVVSATVYESVKSSPGMPRDLVRRFDGDGVDLLYPFRFLGADRRVAAVQYILEQGMDPPMCDVLARAMKEYERRTSERVGFSDHPADCMAFKHLRDALECRRREEAMIKVEHGLQAALTEGAKARLMELMDAKPEEDDSYSVAASLMLLRLSPDEIGVRPVCVAGELGQVQVEDLAAAPKTSQGGAFGTFSIDVNPEPVQSLSSAAPAPARSAWEWVALPQWRALSMARYPVALTLRDCSSVEAVLVGSKVKTDEDKRRMQGPGIIVVDKAVGTFDKLDENAWYLGLPTGSRVLHLVDGKRAESLAARGSLYAAVLFLARPPFKESENRGTDLLQV